MGTIKEVSLHPRIAPCVNMWSVVFFFPDSNIDTLLEKLKEKRKKKKPS
jgi:hypothetical protein